MDEHLLAAVLALPPRHHPARRLLDLLDDPTASATDLGRVMDLDPAIATRAIYLANSPFYGLREPVASSARAITVIGLSSTRALVTSVCFNVHPSRPEDLPPAFWPRAVATAAACATLARRGRYDPGEAFSLGLLHDLGAALLHRRSPQRHLTTVAPLDAGEDLLERERVLFDVDHAELGARALLAARFSTPFARAVHRHHGGGDGGDLGALLRAGLTVAAALGEPDGPDLAAVAAAMPAVGRSPDDAGPVVRETDAHLAELQSLLGGGEQVRA